MKRLWGIVLVLAMLVSACGRTSGENPMRPKPEGTMDRSFAEEFSVEYYAEGVSLLTVGGTEEFLLVPKDGEIPSWAGEMTILRTPMERIYLASSSVADLFLQLDALDAVCLSSTKASGWNIPELRETVSSGKIAYVGKYSTPDFEQVLQAKTELAVENTMIYHKPETMEKLEELGVPVLVERSSYEAHPLGRMEWIKVYGLLTGREAAAERFFQNQLAALQALPEPGERRPTATFFHISASGPVVVQKPGDYVSKMIELAGGDYRPAQAEEENALSSMNMEMEAFYTELRDTDILIYNSTIDGGMDTLSDLLEKNPLLADFKAVKTGNVWCSEQSMFQKTSAAMEMISDFSRIIQGTDQDQLTYMHRLK